MNKEQHDIRIGFDLFERATYPFRGIARYEQYLAEALASLDTLDELVFFSPPNGRNLLPGLALDAHSTFRTIRLTLKQRKFLWMISNLAHLPLDGLLGSVDVFHAPDFVGPWLAHTPLVITVHDLSPWLYPETRTRSNSLFYHTAFPISACRATRIITDSEAIRNDLCKRWPELEEKTTTVHLAPDASYRPEANQDTFRAVQLRLGLPDLYILSVGTLEPRKNYPLLLEAFATLTRHGPEWDSIKLVIVGKKGWHHDEIFVTMRRLGLDKRVILTDSLTDEELCQLYVHCLVFALPSFYEGFGLPVVEAMACSAPVIISTAAALTEVAGDAALIVDPNRVRDLVSALRVVVQDSQKRESLQQRGLERARLFSWERTARETRQVYEEAVRIRHRRRF